MKNSKSKNGTNLLPYKFVSLLALLLTVSLTAFAQAQTISGTVLDASNEPIIGASVLVKGTTNGTITDLDGNFQLTAQPDAMLVISYIGYQTLEVKATPG